MATRIYKDVDGNFRRNNDIIPSGSYRLIYNDDQSKAGIYGKDNYFELIPLTDIANLQNEAGAPYADAAALEIALVGFFQ